MNYWNIKKNPRYKKLCLLVVHLIIVHTNWAQYNTYSPYSRYGIGELQDNASAYQRSMNNAGLAMPVDTTAPAFVNLSNPASLSSVRLAVMEASGGYYHTQILNSQNFKAQQKSANFNSLIIAFPIKRYSGLSFGLLPYSFVGYKINQSENVSNIGNVKYEYEGNGGLNKVFMAYGFSFLKYFKKDTSQQIFKQILKNTSFGFTFNYIFGELVQVAVVNYPSNSLYYNFVNDKRYRINGISTDFGLQTHISFNKNTHILAIGGIFSYPSRLRVFNDYIAYNFSYNYFGDKYIVDTLLYDENEAGKLKLPPVIGIGGAYIVTDKWGFNTDIKFTNWKKFYLVNDNASVVNNIELNAGGYFQPDKFATARGAYFKKVIYRAGIGYNSGYQEYHGKAVPLYSFTTGVTLPMGLYRAFSAMHISIQYAIRGNKSFTLRENIIKVNLGITLNDRWFIKYKYD